MPFFRLLAEHVHDDIAHAPLLLFDRQRGVDDWNPISCAIAFVLVENAALEDAETLFHVARQSQVHAGFVVFQRVAPAQDAAQRHVQRTRK
jgi:hypothetical protein